MKYGRFIEECLRKSRPRRNREREARRLEQRASLAGSTIRLTPELMDPTNPANPLALAPYFPWRGWRDYVPPSWDHRELRWYNWAEVLEDDGHTILKTKDEDSLLWLKETVLAVSPLLRQNHIEVPVWYEIRTRNGDWRGIACPKQTFGGEVVPNSIGLDTLESPTALIFHALHEGAHCVAEAGGPLDPEIDTCGHGPAFRERFGLLLHSALEGAVPLTPGQRRWLRQRAHHDTYAPPTHPKEGWLWVEEPK